MKRTVFLIIPTLLAAGALRAEVPRPREAVIDSLLRPGAGAAAGLCSIVRYEANRPYLWVWSGWTPGDRIGVVFDLPADCGLRPGGAVRNEAFWWYWRYTVPGWGYTVTYDLYEADREGAPVGEPLGTIEGVVPVEGWNNYGGFGRIDADRVALVASWAKGVIPKPATDRAVQGRKGASRSFFYAAPGEKEQPPPVSFTEEGMPLEILMSASFRDAPPDTAAGE